MSFYVLLVISLILIKWNHLECYILSTPSNNWKSITITTNKQAKRRQYSPNKYLQASTSSNDNTIETWRIYDIKISSNDDTIPITLSREQKKEKTPSETRYVTPTLYTKVKQIIKKNIFQPKSKKKRNVDSTYETNVNIVNVRVVRRSLDARKRKGRNLNSVDDATPPPPMYVYIVDVDFITPFPKFKSSTSHKIEKLRDVPSIKDTKNETPLLLNQKSKPKVVIIGYGPAGIFASFHLQSKSKYQTIVLEKGAKVSQRGKDIGKFIHRHELNTQSNFCYGEGGAGTFSDGKLTTRIGRNSRVVRYVLETLVRYGAPDKILVDGAPHLGTDNLVRLLKNLREDYVTTYGGDVRFNANVLDILHDGTKVTGVKVQYNNNPNDIEVINADAVVIATGHSSRDIYDIVYKNGIKIQPKGFSVGFRIEHPQALINKIQYGDIYGDCVVTGNSLTDRINHEFFNTNNNQGSLPVASYRLAASNINDGANSHRSVYSFCMCPGGQIVSTSTTPDELCVNGMSFSKRDSKWANSALVVSMDANDAIIEQYATSNSEEDLAMAGIYFQQCMERQAALLGGGDYVCPVQRVTDFLEGKYSTTTQGSNFPSSSYRLGIKSSSLCNPNTLYPQTIISSLQTAITTNFETYMPGYISDQALLHGVETRTSSPVRIPRDDETLQSSIRYLYPAGEGAGYAGGIVSAAVDGLYVANAIDREFYGEDDDIFDDCKTIGFDY